MCLPCEPPSSTRAPRYSHVHERRAAPDEPAGAIRRRAAELLVAQQADAETPLCPSARPANNRRIGRAVSDGGKLVLLAQRWYAAWRRATGRVEPTPAWMPPRLRLRGGSPPIPLRRLSRLRTDRVSGCAVSSSSRRRAMHQIDGSLVGGSSAEDEPDVAEDEPSRRAATTQPTLAPSELALPRVPDGVASGWPPSTPAVGASGADNVGGLGGCCNDDGLSASSVAASTSRAALVAVAAIKAATAPTRMPQVLADGGGSQFLHRGRSRSTTCMSGGSLVARSVARCAARRHARSLWLPAAADVALSRHTQAASTASACAELEDDGLDMPEVGANGRESYERVTSLWASQAAVQPPAPAKPQQPQHRGAPRRPTPSVPVPAPSAATTLHASSAGATAGSVSAAAGGTSAAGAASAARASVVRLQGSEVLTSVCEVPTVVREVPTVIREVPPARPDQFATATRAAAAADAPINSQFWLLTARFARFDLSAVQGSLDRSASRGPPLLVSRRASRGRVTPLPAPCPQKDLTDEDQDGDWFTDL
ncbi:hypothetical protein OAO87_04135 [bacterium]|nr:hypothetical protein [bacterium]